MQICFNDCLHISSAIVWATLENIDGEPRKAESKVARVLGFIAIWEGGTVIRYTHALLFMAHEVMCRKSMQN